MSSTRVLVQLGGYKVSESSLRMGLRDLDSPVASLDVGVVHETKINERIMLEIILDVANFANQLSDKSDKDWSHTIINDPVHVTEE